MEPGFTGSKDASVWDLTVKTGNGYKGLLLLPQTLNPWITKTGGTDENPEYKITGTARVLVKCKLVDTASDVQLIVARQGLTRGNRMGGCLSGRRTQGHKRKNRTSLETRQALCLYPYLW